MKMKFRAHDTFYIRKGWLSKGMRCVFPRPDLFLSHEENPMDVLGIGANMVKALRYWLPIVGLTKEETKGRRVQNPTELGELVYQNDPYVEELGTLGLLHYRMVTEEEGATAWYYFFNEFSLSEFSKEDFVRELKKYIIEREGECSYAERSLGDDFQCIINTYLPRSKQDPEKSNPENNIDCPFGELGLVSILDSHKKLYKKSVPSVEALNPYVLMAVIAECAGERKEISLNELLTAPRNIGRVFNLDSISMLDALYRMEKLGFIKINRTAGSDVILILAETDFLGYVRQYYAALNG